jgi:hypothetical protein
MKDSCEHSCRHLVIDTFNYDQQAYLILRCSKCNEDVDTIEFY